MKLSIATTATLFTSASAFAPSSIKSSKFNPPPLLIQDLIE